jgi:hypothetical protein
MPHITGHDRSQLLLLPESLDDYVGPENPVRFIEAFVDGLDLAGAGFERVSSPRIPAVRATCRPICSSSASTAISIASVPVGGWKPRPTATSKSSGCCGI